jgi:hypothetical protein
MMEEYGKNGSEYEKSQPGDTETERKMKQLADERAAMRGTSMLIGNRRMRRDKKESRKMER